MGHQALQQQEAALQVQVSHLTLQNLELRRELSSGWMLAEPNILQVRLCDSLVLVKPNSSTQCAVCCTSWGIKCRCIYNSMSAGCVRYYGSCVQVRQLLLDPAVQQEFMKLRRELEDHKSIIQQLKEQNDSLTFTAVRDAGHRGLLCLILSQYNNMHDITALCLL